MISGPNVIVQSVAKPIASLADMSFGNMPNEGGFLLLDTSESEDAIKNHHVDRQFIRPFIGSQEFIKGHQRYCIWVDEQNYSEAKKNVWLNKRFEAVRIQRLASNRLTTKQLSSFPYRFGEVRQRGDEYIITIPAIIATLAGW